jgi:hypothetical protein
MNKVKMENGKWKIKKLIINSLGEENDDGKITWELLERIEYDFGGSFAKSVLAKILDKGKLIRYEFDKRLRLAFRSVSVAAAAAIIFMMISIFLKDGELSVDSLLGIEDGYSESIVYLLTGDL